MTVLTGHRKPGKKWTVKDRSFALALTIYEAELCNGCGQPMSMSTGELTYQIDTITCEACAELEDHRDGSAEHVNGEKTYVTAVT